MYYYCILMFVIALLCYMEYSEKKANATQAKELKQKFDAWIEDTENDKPSNAIFTELYKKRYGKETHAHEVITGNRAVIKRDKIDVIASFPSTHNQLLRPQLVLVDNLESYYQTEFAKLKSLRYWVQFVFNIPKMTMDYLGIDSTTLTAKVTQLILWLLGLLLSPLIELIKELIRLHLLQKLGK